MIRTLLCTFTLLLSVSLPAVAQTTRPALIPEPREFQSRNHLSLGHGVSVASESKEADDSFAVDDLAGFLKERKIPRVSKGVRIRFMRDESATAKRLMAAEKQSLDAAMQDEGYILLTAKDSVYVIAHSATGIFYGAQTAKQLISGSGDKAVFEGCVIRDWPAMRYRGVHDDLSRGPVPTLEFQKKQIRTFAAYKLNVYSPYFENTMQYASNPLPALPGGSISKADAQALVEYAKQYHVTIVPEQEAFGHLHHVLTWQQYAHLAEVPSGAVLAPGETGSLQLIQQWFTELASVFPGPFLHIGADETFELGRGKTAEEVKQRGLGAVYMDFLKAIHTELAPLHRRLLFWGDVAMNDPQLVTGLPKDMIAVAWHYEPEANFSKWLDPYTKAGMETWVAPGVNNWSLVYPNNDIALKNIQGFVAAGQAAGSTGMLNTIWNDDGEGLFAEDWYGILFGAAAGWQAGSSDIAEFQKNYGSVFHGDATGDLDQAQMELIAGHLAMQKTGVSDVRDSMFWVDPWSAEGQETAAKIKPALEEVRQHAERALTLIAQARQATDLREPEAVDAMEMGARRMDFLAFKFQTAGDIADGYLKLYRGREDPEIRKHMSRDLFEISGVNGRCQDLRDGYGYIRDMFQTAWLKENRPFWLDNVLAQYDVSMQLWINRADKIRMARQQWLTLHTLPTPESIGIEQVSISK
ncbi:glycoside hydrolase family 20 zincin-like fold domain-containing protein [Acidobacterium sp. S8]|uniref:glycoside hydrolase family 20 zincin-like fold domain-containing protein n=1 Tax=Acidobacterium sp. S8 TaxID=1641854 RepID=UPI0020B12A53|nr:glycoside hydrolase family 20 zincin-like fold domain-containing protein [Acidobacterium sp. S8]